MATHSVDEHLVDGRYALKEKLGRGGFGIVWRAHDTLLQRDVAIKEVEFPSVLEEHERAALREKILREARAAARLSHPALVTVFDVVEEDERPLIVMELVAAPTLADRVDRSGPLPDREAAVIGQEVLDALTTAHSQGIIHRDVKPANVMVADNGRVQLGDFGIASVIDDPKVTSSGQLAGSPSYMAPEQAHNKPAGAATDLWGLGATLYFAVEGEPPFEKDGALPTLTSVVSDDPRPMRRATTLAPLLRDLLVKDPDARPSVDEVRRRLAEAASAAETAAPAAPPPPPSQTMTFEADVLSRLPQEPPPAPEPPRSEPEPEPVVVSRPAPPTRPARRPNYGLIAAVGIVVIVLIAALLANRGDDPPSTVAGDAPETTAVQEAEEPADEEAAEAPPHTQQQQPTATNPPASTAPAEGVPRNWVSYTDPATGFTISHPPGWSPQRNGTLTDFRDPATGTYLRVDYTSSPGPSAEQAWRDYEPRFAAENPDYRRIQITPTTFKGYPAAIWEFTYTGRGTPLRAIDLGFVTGPYGFALNFQAPAARWSDMQDEFEAFKASFRAPGG